VAESASWLIPEVRGASWLGKACVRTCAKAVDGLARLARRAGSATGKGGVLVEGAGSGTRTLRFRPNAQDPNWGLTKGHLGKHLFGSGSKSLKTIDPGGNPDVWRNHIQDLAGRPATTQHSSGIQDIIGTFPKTGGPGTFRFGIRISPRSDGAYDLVTLLTKQ
jgi:hypothetical protein